MAQSVKASFHISPATNLHNGKIKDLGKFIVTGIVCRNSHYGAGSVGHKNIVGNKYRDLLSVNGIYCLNAAESYTGFSPGSLGALKVGFLGRFGAIGFDLVDIFGFSAHFSTKGCSGLMTI